jgi:hypothetical protein
MDTPLPWKLQEWVTFSKSLRYPPGAPKRMKWYLQPYLLDAGNLNTWLFNPIFNLKTISNPISKQRDVPLNPKASRDLHPEIGNTPIPTP